MNPPTGPIQHLTPSQVDERLRDDGSVMLLDIREANELAVCQLTGARHIPLSQMSARWQEIPQDRPVVVFCHHGVRSAYLIEQLQAAGFTNLINMHGGIDAWSLQVDSSIPRY